MKYAVFLLAMFEAHAWGGGLSAKDSISPEPLPPTPYWCAKVELQQFKKAIKSKPVLKREIDSIQACYWSAKLLAATPVKDAKELAPQKLKVLVVRRNGCAELKKGTVIEALAGGEYYNGVSAKSAGTLEKAGLEISECDCSQAVKAADIPRKCSLEFE